MTNLHEDNSLLASASDADVQNHRKLKSGNLILVGMMGCGKTTIGRSLSRQLCMPFIDCDEEIIKRTGVTIPHIFDVEGEAGFRLRETAAIRDLVARENVVLATGGGAVLSEENRKLLLENGIVIYLKANSHDLWHRTRYDKNRPLLQHGDAQGKLKELLQQRDPFYREVADVVVQSGKQSAHTLMLHLVDEISKFKRNYGGTSDTQTT